MSTKLTIKEAVEVIPVSESTLRRDLKSGNVSSEKDLQGRRRIDVSELARVYGELEPRFRHAHGKKSTMKHSGANLKNEDITSPANAITRQPQKSSRSDRRLTLCTDK